MAIIIVGCGITRTDLSRLLVRLSELPVNAPQIFDETGDFLLWSSWNGTASEMAPAVVNSTKSEVMAALEVASFRGHTNVIFLLFALGGVTVNASDVVGRNALFFVCINGQL